jgi:hypothetical protein
MKGACRSVGDCSKFKEANQWQQWDRRLQFTASAQGVEIFFNPSHVPSTDEEKELFVEQQKFGCQVLKQTMLTSEGMVIVFEHSQTKNDGQSVHPNSQDRHAHSQAVTLAQDILEQEIIDFRLKATWKKGCAPFLIAWKNKVMDLETL